MRIITTLILLVPFLALSQQPLKEEGSLLYKKEFGLGFDLTTRGMGGFFYYGWQKKAGYKNILEFDLHFIGHPKEVKSNSSFGFDQNKPYYYGKLISFFSIDPSIGGKKRLFKKRRFKGVGIAWRWSVGPSFGFQKPVYLVIASNGISSRIERYDPEIHTVNNIRGRAGWGTGLSETRITFGAFGKTGFVFDIAAKETNIFGIETGVMINAYFPSVQIMADNKAEYVLPVFYLNLFFGKKKF